MFGVSFRFKHAGMSPREMVANRVYDTESGLLTTSIKNLMMNHIRKFLISFLWLLPFGSFLLGYQLLRVFTHAQSIIVPSVIGLHLHDAIKQLSAEKLNVRILMEKEEPDLQEGMILSQTPVQGAMVKPHQSIFLVLTRRPPKVRAPALFGFSVEEARSKADQLGLTLRIHRIESRQPYDTIIAQGQIQGKELDSKVFGVYVSHGITPLRVFPDLRGKIGQDIQSFFKSYDTITVELLTPSQEKGDPAQIVIDQRPAAGSLIDIRKPLAVQLIVSKA
jgi:eukaryotic-like serine/threonine-protein kinase